ncbi:hypothetical protein JCM8202v2_005981 [Rhodotorula sphaerocarpa]
MAQERQREQQQQQLSILRIKRKRTQQPTPLDALVIEQLEPSTKRRKGDAAAASTREVRPAPPARGIFRFAETVPLDSFSTPVKTRSLRDRIQSFLAHPPPGLARSASSASLRKAFTSGGAAAETSAARAEVIHDSSAARDAPPSPASTTGSRRKLPSALRAARAAAISTSSSSSSLQATITTPESPRSPALSSARAARSAESPRLAALHAEKSRIRYRVVEQRRAFFTAQAEAEEAARRERGLEDEEIRKGLRPPRIEDSRLRAKADKGPTTRGKKEVDDEAGIKIYEAVAELEAEASASDPAQAAAMNQFGSMLNEYLSIQEDISPSSSDAPRPADFSFPSSDPTPSQAVPSADDLDTGAGQSSQLTDDEGDYVYDVYYRAMEKPAARAAAAAAAAAVPGASDTEVAPAGAGGFDVSSLAGLSRIGQLAGLAEDSDDEAQVLMHEQDGDLSTEEEDNADQDSNEENDYRNDYPDEDEPDSDNNKVEYRDPQRVAWSDDDDDDSDGMEGDSDQSSVRYDEESDGDY